MTDQHLPATTTLAPVEPFVDEVVEEPSRPLRVALLPLAVIAFVILAFVITAWTFLTAT